MKMESKVKASSPVGSETKVAANFSSQKSETLFFGWKRFEKKEVKGFNLAFALARFLQKKLSLHRDCWSVRERESERRSLSLVGESERERVAISKLC